MLQCAISAILLTSRYLSQFEYLIDLCNTSLHTINGFAVRHVISSTGFVVTACYVFVGDLHEAEVRTDEEGVRAERVVRLRDRSHHLQQQQPPLPVRQHRHGPRPPQVHRVQRTARVAHQ